MNAGAKLWIRPLLLLGLSVPYISANAATTTNYYVYDPFKLSYFLNSDSYEFDYPVGFLTIELTENSFRVTDMSVPLSAYSPVVPQITALGSNNHYVADGFCRDDINYCYWVDAFIGGESLLLDVKFTYGGDRFEGGSYNLTATAVPSPPSTVPIPSSGLLFCGPLTLLLRRIFKEA